ncbi:MAG TPA: hypothetical protein VMH05_17775 [Bryobacteraceae bacterium]|nr:hypothetical protein [Bryobacteraceae bacterium]
MLPEIAIVAATRFVLEHLLPEISGSLSQDVALLGLGVALLVQAVVFGLPPWIALMIAHARRTRSTNI